MKTNKGFTTLAVIILGLLVIGGGYMYINSEPEIVDDSQNSREVIENQMIDTQEDDNTQQGILNNTDTIKGEVSIIGGYEIDNPINYSFEYNNSLNVSKDSSGANITKFRNNRVILPLDCGGFLAEDDELKMSFQLSSLDTESVVERYSAGKILIDEDGVLVKGKRNISGMCENGDEFIMKTDKFYIIFNIRPSSTNLVEEYEQIIKTFNIE